ncbi:MAG: PQQ-binding-like beta-propeller repeat protein, partial [Actinomycetota bacterium]|nr:PQQ-binding-like beta-propeller repeat protein [Actinomycetota bacterium]
MPSLRTAVVIAGCALTSLASALEGNAQEAPWPMAGHDPAHTGTGAGPGPPYRVAWTVENPAGGAVAAPVVAADRVIVVGRSAVVALSTADGEVIWEEPRFEGPASDPAIAGDLVIHASGRGDRAALVARSLDDGRREWSANLGAAVLGGPTVSGELAVAGTTDGRLVALDAASGQERWSYEGEGAFDGAPAIGDGLVVAVDNRVGDERGAVVAIDAEVGTGDGPPEWQFSPPIPGRISAPAIGEGYVAMGTAEQLIRVLGLRNGDERTSARTRDAFAPRQIPATGDGLIVAGAAHVSRIDPETGDETWTFQLADLRPLQDGRYNTLIAASPVVIGDVVLIGDGAGGLS